MNLVRVGKPNRLGSVCSVSLQPLSRYTIRVMKNDMNFSKLQNLAGWSKEQITELQQALHAREYFGYANLTADQKQIIVAARAAEKVTTKVTKTKGTKQPVQTKLHYRWRAAEAELLRKYSELAPGEVPT